MGWLDRFRSPAPGEGEADEEGFVHAPDATIDEVDPAGEPTGFDGRPIKGDGPHNGLPAGWMLGGHSSGY